MIAQVILQSYSIFNEPFSYAVPSHFQHAINIGQMVAVPFRSKKEKGIIVDIQDKEPLASYKPIDAILSSQSVLFPYQIYLAQWISVYYSCPLCKALDLFLPRYVWQEKQDDWVQRTTNVHLVSDTVRGEKAKKVVDLLKDKKIAPLQEALNIPAVTLAYIKQLEKKGIISLSYGDIIPPYFKNYDLETISVVEEKGLKRMTTDQQRIFNTIEQRKGGTFLLHGITGSGKTEVYLHVAYKNYKEENQTLVLVPEIALTPQLIAYFFKVFGKRISVIHSHLSEGEKFTEWVRIKNKESYVIIGSRSALFAPFQSLGGIVLDEEHEWTYKSEQNPRYHARTAAIELAKYLGISVILGSATPDIESYFKATKGEYVLLELSEKIGGGEKS